jgi:hypothetical protein
MRAENQAIKSTAGQVTAELERRGIDPARPVKVMVGRPSLSVIGRRLQGEAARGGMNAEVHDQLLDELKQPR